MIYDILIIGGGINGAGIARDAAGRGLSVLLVEKDDLASHTSSSSTKLIHGGLRYLEHYEFRLVREALIERERLLAIAPHIIWPLTFVLPHANGTRPAWMVRTGLFLYDHLGGRKKLPASRGVSLRGTQWGAGLNASIARGFTYADCWVDDARLVVLNAMDAAQHGATICTRTTLTKAHQDGDMWRATLSDAAGERDVSARTIVNAAGPWVGQVLSGITDAAPEAPPRLVKGSHLIVPRLFDGDHAYILQNPDGRIVFAIPYEHDFTLIGTTDVIWTQDPGSPQITQDEIDYLCESINRYFTMQVSSTDVIRTYAGIRPLFDDGADSASEITRDYVLRLGTKSGPQMLSVFGGKITTYRKLAEHALEKLASFLPAMKKGWTDRTPLPGGDISEGDFEAFLSNVRQRWPALDAATSLRLARAYGTKIEYVIGGTELGGGVTTKEIDYLIEHEWARTIDDILWRRSKLGLHIGPEVVAAISKYIDQRGA